MSKLVRGGGWKKRVSAQNIKSLICLPILNSAGHLPVMGFDAVRSITIGRMTI